MPPLSNTWKNNLIIFIGAILLSYFYLSGYFHDMALPQPDARFPEGWWGWFDQSKYLQSAQALAHGNLTESEHWYPFGYALIGAPFAWMGYHIYLIPDLLCLLATGAAIITFGRLTGIPLLISVIITIYCTMFPDAVRTVWSEPWNTSLASPLIWWAITLGTGLSLLPGARQFSKKRTLLFFIFGMILAFIPITRPTDLLISGIIATFCLITAIYNRTFSWKEFSSATVGFTGLLTLCGILYLSIYGPHPSQYMVISKNLGFRTDLLWWKTYLLLITPRPWFPDGYGILENMHWIFLSLCGLVTLFLTAKKREHIPFILLSVLCITYSLLFFSYTDLIPSGFWRYHNIHYFKWVFPALGIMAWYFLSILFSAQWKIAATTMAALFLVTCIRLLPAERKPEDRGIMMVQVPETPPGWNETYFRDFSIRDQIGLQKHINDFRSVPDQTGERWIALHRPLAGPVTPALPHDTISQPYRYWGIKVTFRPDPCWLPPHACKYKKPAE